MQRMRRGNGGQVLLIVVVAISTALVSVSVVSGLLIAGQLRQSSNVVDSAKAVFAADTGFEQELYCFFRKIRNCLRLTALGNGASLISEGQFNPATNQLYIRSTGTSRRVSRAFDIVLR